MSISSTTSSISQISKEITKLEKDFAYESKKKLKKIKRYFFRRPSDMVRKTFN